MNFSSYPTPQELEVSEIAIDPNRLKTVRKARKVGRPKLAKLSGLTERKLAKIEAGQQSLLSEALVLKLSDALNVPSPTLTGQFPLTEDDLKQETTSDCTSGCCG